MQAAVIVGATRLPHRTAQYALKGLAEKGLLQRKGQGAAARYQLVF